MPEYTHFLKKGDFTAALTILECDKKYSHRQDMKTFLGIAYCAFHNGDYKYGIFVINVSVEKHLISMMNS